MLFPTPDVPFKIVSGQHLAGSQPSSAGPWRMAPEAGAPAAIADGAGMDVEDDDDLMPRNLDAESW